MKVALVMLASLLLATPVSAKNDRKHDRTIGFGQIYFDGAGPEMWAKRYRQEQQRVKSLRRQLQMTRRTVLKRPTVSEAISLACAVYGNCSTLWRKARCESGLYPYARNPSGAAGLFQFLPSTWRGTPFGGFSIFSPYANALAAGWMHARGRGGEWQCA